MSKYTCPNQNADFTAALDADWAPVPRDERRAYRYIRRCKRRRESHGQRVLLGVDVVCLAIILAYAISR